MEYENNFAVLTATDINKCSMDALDEHVLVELEVLGKDGKTRYPTIALKRLAGVALHAQLARVLWGTKLVDMPKQ